MYFNVTVKYLKPAEGEDADAMKKVDEKYLVDAMSVTEAEAKVIEWFPDNYQDLSVNAAVFFELDSIVTTGKSETYYLGRIKFPEETKKGKIKMKSFQVMVNGDNLKDALNNMIEAFHDESAVDYEMDSIANSKIIIDGDLVKI